MRGREENYNALQLAGDTGGRGDATGSRADGEGDEGADHEIPRVGDGGEAEEIENDGQSGKHAKQRAWCGGAFVEGSEKKETEEAAEGEGNYGQTGLEERAPLDEAESHQDQAPGESHAAGKLEEIFGIERLAPEAREIENAGGGEGVEGAAGIGHGYGDDGSEEEAGESWGHFADEEEREDAVCALAGSEERGVLSEGEEKHTDQEEDGELDQDDDAAGEEGAAAVAFVACGEKALDDNLIGAVGGHGEKGAADEPGPEGVPGGPVEGEIEELEFVSGGGCNLGDFAPSAGNAVQQYEESDGAAGQVNHELCDVGPDDGAHAAFEGVQNGQGDYENDGEFFRGAKDDADDQGDGGDADAFGNGAGDEERAGGDGAHFLAEAFFDEGVGGEEFSAEVAGEEEKDDQNAPDQVAEDELEKGEVTSVGDGGGADDGEGGGFRGHDGKGQGPPGGGASAEKIVAGVLLLAAEAHAECGYGQQIGDDDC